MNPNNSIPYTFYRYSVPKTTWHKLVVKIHPSTRYKKGTIKIMNSVDKSLLMPEVRLPNIIFTNNKKPASVEEMESYDNFEIVFFSDNCPMVHIYATNLKILSIGIKEIKPLSLKKEVDLWKLRRQFDLELLNYYLSKNFDDFNPPDFLDRFNAEYKLFKNPNYLNNFVQQLNLSLPEQEKHEDTKKVLYLVQLSAQYESSMYALRTQYLLNEANQIDDEYQICAVTRYGYPYDRERDYYVGKPLNNNIDNVSYIKLTNKSDNFNDNNLIEYLKKYIVETIKLAHSSGARIIHSCNNFYNGVASVYASKYLGIKSIYEIRSLWEYEHRPDVYDSDVLTMRRSMEDLVIQKADKIITVNEDVKKQLISRGVDVDKICIVGNGMIADKKIDEETKKNLKSELGLDEWDIVIGYIGQATKELVHLTTKIKELKECHNLNVGLFMISGGEERLELFKNVQEQEIGNNFKLIDNVDESKHGRFIDLMDIAFYPVYDDALLKVMAQEKPIIAFQTEKIKEIIVNDINGIYANNENLVETIVNLHHDQKLKNRLTEGSKEYISKFHGWKEPATELIKLYGDMLG